MRKIFMLSAALMSLSAIASDYKSCADFAFKEKTQSLAIELSRETSTLIINKIFSGKEIQSKLATEFDLKSSFGNCRSVRLDTEIKRIEISGPPETEEEYRYVRDKEICESLAVLPEADMKLSFGFAKENFISVINKSKLSQKEKDSAISEHQLTLQSCEVLALNERMTQPLENQLTDARGKNINQNSRGGSESKERRPSVQQKTKSPARAVAQ